MMTYTIYGYKNNPRTRLIRVVAAAQGIHLDELEVIPRKNVNRDLLIEKFPMSAGKIPALEGPDIKLTETVAIALYLAKTGEKRGLLGDGSVQEEALVMSWMSWSNQELLVILARWFLPLIPNFSSPAPYNREAIEAGKQASLTLLEKLESSLSGKKFLVGNSITLADIFVCIMLSRGLEWVLGEEWRRAHANCMRHFNMMREWGPVKEVIPGFVLIKEETPNVDPYA
ncbi:glutathione-S-transferase theta, GST [Xylariaceae sp. FL0255]|nr:glutathione-S-transferase theta, GST [Xylariaceae sp. FL0255]